jgi:molybdate/tungstate transport system ATP-binding protein
MTMLKINNLSIRLGKFELRDINLQVARGEYFVLLGMSGSGKSVLLQVVGGLLRAAGGEIFLNGKEITRESIQRRNVGMVFQDSVLFPHMSVSGNIAYPLKTRRKSAKEIRMKVAELADITSVTHLLNRGTRNLSGGESQRVALARALATEPDCLLLDEPLSSLDVHLRGEIRALLRKINALGQTVVHVTHDYEEAAMLAKRIGVIEQGTIVQAGDITDVFTHPRTEFVARFTGIKNFFSGTLKAGPSTLKIFETAGFALTVLSDDPPGEGFVIIRAEDITVSENMPGSSAVNNFMGRVVGIDPARVGTEIVADIGITLAVLLSDESVAALRLHPGKTAWFSIKASAIKYIRK